MKNIFLALGGLIVFVLGQQVMMQFILPTINDPNLATIVVTSFFGLMGLSLLVIPLLVVVLQQQQPQPHHSKPFVKNDRNNQNNKKQNHGNQNQQNRNNKRSGSTKVPDDVAQAMRENENKQE